MVGAGRVLGGHPGSVSILRSLSRCLQKITQNPSPPPRREVFPPFPHPSTSLSSVCVSVYPPPAFPSVLPSLLSSGSPGCGEEGSQGGGKPLNQTRVQGSVSFHRRLWEPCETFQGTCPDQLVEPHPREESSRIPFPAPAPGAGGLLYSGTMLVAGAMEVSKAAAIPGLRKRMVKGEGRPKHQWARAGGGGQGCCGGGERASRRGSQCIDWLIPGGVVVHR